jgi:hypothetical protein
MSIGNLKDYGNKGNNFPWQLKMLEGIQQLINASSGITPGQARTPNSLRSTGPWTTTTLVYSFSVANVGTGDGTVMGETIKTGEIENFDAGGMNNFFPIGTPVADGTGTELLITWISA